MSRMALAAPSILATSAGASLVESGGNAADAIVAMALAAMCTEPGVCAPGAGGFVTVDAGDGNPVTIDGYVAVPGLGFRGTTNTNLVSMAYGGGITTAVGPGSIAVPGSFAALELVSKNYGHVPWTEILSLVADLVAPGFPLSQACRTYLVDSGTLIFSQDPAIRAALFDGDRLKEIGETVVIEGLAESLRQIGEEGADSFYRGDLGEVVVADLVARGASLTAKDLVSYRPLVRKPVSLELGRWTVVSNPAPAVGGVTMLDAVQRIANSPVPLKASVWQDALVAAQATRKELESAFRSPSTITVSAVDSSGTAVAATFSAGYGSGVIPTGTGLLMNNSLGELELIPGGPESLVPGERMISNMAPTTARSGDSAVALGSPGADRITSALAITLVRFLLADDSLTEAIEYPRVHVESVDPLLVAAETGLSLSGDKVRWYSEPHMFFGGVNAAALIDGVLVAHADTRRTGSAVLV